MKKIILASSSPRRKMLLKQAGLSFDVVTADCDENVSEAAEPFDVVIELAQRKGSSVFLRLAEEERENAVIIAADTVVCGGGKIYGKPVSQENALEMLLSLSGKVHSVYTGVCIVYCTGGKKHMLTFYEETKVEMKKFGKDEALMYIKTGEPMDKAGAYGIQGYGALLVAGIKGDFYNVVGLPLCRLCDILHNSLEIDMYKCRGGIFEN